VSVGSVTAAKFDKFLHFISIFIARKLVTGLIIQYVSFNIIGKNIIPKPNIFTRTRTQNRFRDCNLCTCILPAETISSWFFLLSCLVTELQKPFSQGFEPRADFRSYDLYPVISSLEKKNFGLGAVRLSCLVYELQKKPSLGLKLKTLSEFWPFLNLFLISRHKNATFDTYPQSIPMIAFALYGIFCRRRDNRRRDARRGVASVISYGVT
jgi:hypothetical protein